MNPDLRENISRVSGFFEKFHNTEIRVFRPISGLPVVLPKVSCFKRPLNTSTTFSNHCLVAYLTHGSDKNNMIIRDSTTQKILDHSLFFLWVSTVSLKNKSTRLVCMPRTDEIPTPHTVLLIVPHKFSLIVPRTVPQTRNTLLLL